MKKFKKFMSILLAAVISIPYFANIAVSAEGTEKYPYMIFGRNGNTTEVFAFLTSPVTVISISVPMLELRATFPSSSMFL